MPNDIDNPRSHEISPAELFAQLRQRQDQMKEAAFEAMRTEAARIRFFGKALFAADTTRASKKVRDLLSDERHKYQFLLLLLKKHTDPDKRRFILAKWLYQEGVCQPEELLGKRFVRYRNAALPGFPLTAVRQAFIVDIWTLYFERLLRDRRQGLDLRRLGFEEKAVEAAAGKQRAVSAACQWLAPRFSITPAALANAHSRVYRPGRRVDRGLLKRNERRGVS
jgi:hypothetical protein